MPEEIPLQPEWTVELHNPRAASVSFRVHRWPRKALWSKLTEQGVFDLGRDPREERREHGLSRKAEALPSFADAIDDPASATLVRQLARHVEAFRRLAEGRSPAELDRAEREMLEALGYL